MGVCWRGVLGAACLVAAGTRKQRAPEFFFMIIYCVIATHLNSACLFDLN
jgi:hypothetical protein